MTVPLLSLATLFICATSASADTKLRRSLLQQQQQVVGASTSLYRPTASGGLTLFSNLTVLSDGQSSRVYPLNASSTGSTVVLQQYSLRRTPVVQNAACIQVGLTANSTRVRSFLTTYSNYLNMMQGNYFVLSTANAVAGSNLSSASRTPALVSVDPTEQYVDLIFSLDLNPQLIQYRLSAYPPGASECAAAAPSGGMTQPFGSMSTAAGGVAPSAPRTAGSGRRLLQRSGAYSPASAPSPSASRTQTAQLSKQDVLSDGSIVAPAAFTNASCIGYKLFGQDPDYARNHRIDVTVVVIDLPNMLRWAAQEFTFRPSNVSFRAACLQNSSHPGDCGAYIDQLDPGQIYYVLGITGIQQVRVISSDVIFDLYFTAQASGSCANNAVQSYSTGIDFELTDPYDYYDYEDRADGPAAPDTGMDDLAPYLVGNTAPGASPTASQSAQPPNGIVLYGSTQEGGQLFPLPGK